MTSEDNLTRDTDDLRRKAEDIAREKTGPFPENLDSLSSEEIRQVLLDLRVHQIELEMQNEELRQALEAQQRNAAIYRLVVESINDIIWTFDLSSMTFTFISPSVQQILGYADEPSVKNLDLIFNPGTKRHVLKKFVNFVESNINGDTLVMEAEHIHKDGSLIWMEIGASPLKDDSGKIVGFLGTSRNITERKKAEEVLRETERKYRELFELSPVGIFKTNSKGQTLFANPEMARIVGADFSKKAVDKFQDLTKDFYLDPNCRNEFIELIKVKDAVENFEFEAKGLNGKRLWLSMNARAREKLSDGTFIIDGFITDVTERKQADEALRESEKKYRLIAENTVDLILILDMNLHFIYVSPAIMSLRGFTVEEAMEQTLEQVLTPESMRLALDIFEKEMLLEASGTADPDRTRIMELEEYKKDGSTIWVEVSFSYLRDKDRKPVEILTVARDVTARKQAEEERKAHIFFLESLERIDRAIKEDTDVEQMMQAILTTVFSIFDCDRAWLLYPCDPDAPSFRVIVETTRPEYPGANVLNVDVPMSPGEAQNMREALDSVEPMVYTAGTKRPISTAKQFGVQSQMLIPVFPKLGNPWVFGMHQCSYPRIWSEEEKRLFKEIGRRISDGLSSVLFLRELQENEERFRTIFERSTVGKSLMGPDGKLLRINQAFADMLGYEIEEVLQLDLAQITHPDDMAKSRECIRILLTGEQVDYRFEKRYIHKNGDIVWTDVGTTLLRNEQGTPRYFVTSIMDITGRKQADEEKMKLQAQFLQAQKMESVGRLAGGVAHDFNNMLGIILGHTELAMDQVDPDSPIHADLDEIRDATNRSADLTRQLLAFARKQTIFPKVLDLNETLESMLKMLRRLIGENIDLSWLPGKGLWPVNMDPSQIDQILANLCINARDAIDGEGKVLISTGNVTLDEIYCTSNPGSVPGEYVALSVCDDGCGMDRETRDRIFEPFFTTKEMGKGTGLGLATVYGIVKQNNGFINVYSESGMGTTFKIYLNRHMGKAGQLRQGVSAEPAKRGTETILLVEDDPSILDMTTIMLEHLGYTVLAASTPDEAIRLTEAHPEDAYLLMTDVVMPRMNGRDLAGKLQSLSPNLKILFMSGYTADVIAHNGVIDPGVHFIQKPFSMRDLAEMVRKVLDTKLKQVETEVRDAFKELDDKENT